MRTRTGKNERSFLTRAPKFKFQIRTDNVTGYPSMDSAIESVNRNAGGYILKPVDLPELLAMIEKQLKKQREDFEYRERKVAQ